ncbi:MAG: hypothetical protein KGP35_06360 [Bacteroidetes bacterium]|nr:hypothetical protein [Bacteroidota bacterium]
MCRFVIPVFFLWVFIVFSNSSFAQTPTTVKDVDGFEYKIVRLGTQTWMAQNLNVSRFRNGDPIPEATTEDEWIKADKNKTPAWCYYDNDPEYGAIYGKLYNWYAVIDERGLAPVKWRIPTGEDWERLINFLGNKLKAGEQLKADNGWREGGNGNNKTGFQAFPGGNRSDKGLFLGNGSYGYWWSSQEHGSETADGYDLGYRYKPINQFAYRKGHGFSIRCVK